MSFREKSAWVSLVTTLVVWGYFFVVLIDEVGSRAPNGPRLTGIFVGATILLIILNILIFAVLAILAPKDANAAIDERETLIDLKASRIAFFVQSMLVMGALIALPALGVLGPKIFPDAPLAGTLTVLGGTIFLAIVAAELVHSGWQIFLFRRSA